MAGNILAVLLAAGTGSRLRPLTDTLPKCLLEVGGRPLLDYQLEALAAHGVTDVLVVTGHAAGEITRRYPRLRTVHDPEYAGLAPGPSGAAAPGADAPPPPPGGAPPGVPPTPPGPGG